MKKILVKCYWKLRNILGINKKSKSPLIEKNNNAVKKYDLKELALPLRIDIETINRCNGICPFCPVNAREKQRPYAKMTRELFEKIIGELEEMNYSGSAALFDNNEAFLDDRIIEFQKYAKEHVPNAFWDLWTNGSLITLDKFKQIMPYLDRMVIDNYNDEGKWNPPVQILYDYVQEHEEWKNKVVFSMRKLNEVLTSRGGTAPNKKDIVKGIKAKCVLPFQQLNIRPDGKISLCCNDALGKWTLGDVNNSTIKEIWYSEEYMKIRREMKTNGRKNLDLCAKCDTLGGIFE